MKNPIEIEKPDANLDRWLGRREAFALIAGRCSAAEVESLRRIRTERVYRRRARTWEEFCSQIGVSRRNVERSIRALEEFGPAFFHLAQLTHLKPEEYRVIAAKCYRGRGPYRGPGNRVAAGEHRESHDRGCQTAG